MDSVTEAAERQAAEELYRQVSERAEALELTQTLRALPFMREKHRNQYRKGTGRVPYMVHPLTMALHALSLGITDDTVLAAELLHDVVEDTGTDPEELPVSPEARDIVRRLSYNTYPGPKSVILPRYYAGIHEEPRACLIKCLDRCSNLSGMAGAFTRERICEYMLQTEEEVLPLLKEIAAHPGWGDAAWLLRYQMEALMDTCRNLLERFSG